jgi:hypothetical protein
MDWEYGSSGRALAWQTPVPPSKQASKEANKQKQRKENVVSIHNGVLFSHKEE